MVLASLFLDVGPRGVAPDPAPRRAGLLRVRAQLPGRPARRPRLASRSASCRWPSGSTRCASSRSPAPPTRSARRRPEVEALILVAMVVVFLVLARWTLAALERTRPPRGPAVGALAVTADDRRRARSPTASARPSGAASTRPGRAAAAGVDSRRSFATAVRLGWQMEANWTDPLLFFIYSVAKPLASALILVVMLDVISGGAKPEYRAFVVVGSALWSFVSGGHRRARLDDPRRPRALPDAQVRLRQPERLPRRAVRPRRRPDRRRRRWAPRSRSASASSSSACRSISGRIDWPLLVLVMAPRRRRRSSRSASSSPRSACRPARNRGPIRRPWRAPCSSSAAPCSRWPSCRARSRPIGLLTPLTLVDRGDPAGPVPGRRERRSAAPAPSSPPLRPRTPRAVLMIVLALLATGAVATLAAIGRLPGERSPREGSRAARPDDRLLITATGRAGLRAGRRTEEARCASTREVRARTSRRSSARSAPSSTSAGCARSCSSRRPTGSSSRASSSPARPAAPGPSRSARRRRRR